MKDRKYAKKALIWIAILFPMLLVFPLSEVPGGQHRPTDRPPEISWVEGPRTVDLGNNIAQIDLGEGYIFANAEDTRKLMDYYGNPPSNKEMGIIKPKDPKKNWFILFEYNPTGYVPDDEKDRIDADAILKSIKKGTEEANKLRQKKGFSPIHVLGWYETPHYDAFSNNLSWTILAEQDGGQQTVNYNIRLLGRHGVTEVVLVTGPEKLRSLKPEVENTIANFTYKRGKKYADFVQGDKLAKYGLTALIAGGAGAAAVKFGLLTWLAKAWKLVLVGAMAFFAAISRIFKAIFTREDRMV